MQYCWLFIYCLCALYSLIQCVPVETPIETSEPENFLHLEHPFSLELFNEIRKCDENATYCDDNIKNITSLCAKIANEHNQLLLVDRAKTIFEDILYFIGPQTKIGQRAVHTLAALAFGQGNQKEVSLY